VTDAAVNDIHQAAGRLANKGMKVDRVMPITGVIAGSVAATGMRGLEKLDGVQSVEEEAGVRLAPPDSPVQ
jgi:hypothetical protein